MRAQEMNRTKRRVMARWDPSLVQATCDRRYVNRPSGPRGRVLEGQRRRALRTRAGAAVVSPQASAIVIVAVSPGRSVELERKPPLESGVSRSVVLPPAARLITSVAVRLSVASSHGRKLQSRP